uniref:Uncharacterized protein n=1 Tax=Arundo donax TaxID=35708 RepID=A0A0A9B577_ARUDO
MYFHDLLETGIKLANDMGSDRVSLSSVVLPD